jgi:hypothetical protein
MDGDGDGNAVMPPPRAHTNLPIFFNHQNSHDQGNPGHATARPQQRLMLQMIGDLPPKISYQAGLIRICVLSFLSPAVHGWLWRPEHIQIMPNGFRAKMPLGRDQSCCSGWCSRLRLSLPYTDLLPCLVSLLLETDGGRFRQDSLGWTSRTLVHTPYLNAIFPEICWDGILFSAL